MREKKNNVKASSLAQVKVEVNNEDRVLAVMLHLGTLANLLSESLSKFLNFPTFYFIHCLRFIRNSMLIMQ